MGADTGVTPTLTSIAAWPLVTAALVGTSLTTETFLANAHWSTGSRMADTTIQTRV